MSKHPSSEQGTKRFSDPLLRAGQIAGAITALVTVGLVVWNIVKPAPPPAVLEAKVSELDAQYGESELSYPKAILPSLRRPEPSIDKPA
jgi:hypothetical protein